MTARLLDLAFARRRAPPVDYAWLVFGSAARNEFTLASDQDNGLAYADTDDPAVGRFSAGWRRTSTPASPAAASRPIPMACLLDRASGGWPSRRGWGMVFSGLPRGASGWASALLRAAVVFDYRQAAGRLYVEQALTDVMRDTPKHARLQGRGWRSSEREIDGRRWGFGRGCPADGRHQSERPAAHPEPRPLPRVGARHHDPGDAGSPGRALRLGCRGLPTLHRILREAYLTLRAVQLEHHAEAVRAGGRPGGGDRHRCPPALDAGDPARSAP